MSEFGKIHDEIDELDNQVKQIARTKKRRQNACAHSKNGKTTGILSSHEKGGECFYRCTLCRKDDITMSPPNVEAFVAAVKTVSDGIDWMKIHQGDSPQGRSNVHDCGKALDYLDNMKVMYENMKRQEGKGKNKKDHQRAQRTGMAFVKRSNLN